MDFSLTGFDRNRRGCGSDFVSWYLTFVVLRNTDIFARATDRKHPTLAIESILCCEKNLKKKILKEFFSPSISSRFHLLFISFFFKRKIVQNSSRHLNCCEQSQLRIGKKKFHQQKFKKYSFFFLIRFHFHIHFRFVMYPRLNCQVTRWEFVEKKLKWSIRLLNFVDVRLMLNSQRKRFERMNEWMNSMWRIIFFFFAVFIFFFVLSSF